MALIPRGSPQFTLRLAPDGSKLLTFEDNYGPYSDARALSNICGSWGSWDIHRARLGEPHGNPTRRQAVELVGEDPVRWLEKGAEGC